MTETGKALYTFFSSFGIPAYAENAVPDDAQLPYITYTPVDTTWRQPASVNASVWYKGTSFSDLFSKVDEIKQKVGGGASITTDSGSVWIFPDTPFAQQVSANMGDNVKAMYLLFEIHALCR